MPPPPPNGLGRAAGVSATGADVFIEEYVRLVSCDVQEYSECYLTSSRSCLRSNRLWLNRSFPSGFIGGLVIEIRL